MIEPLTLLYTQNLHTFYKDTDRNVIGIQPAAKS